MALAAIVAFQGNGLVFALIVAPDGQDIFIGREVVGTNQARLPPLESVEQTLEVRWSPSPRL